ncbi:MAG: NUDIX domain-containing protein [Candidatus Micrarchaeota archaeon]|nr:NUDIX domain-containing protein [Candidatus Micrarchaeota archaeon]
MEKSCGAVVFFEEEGRRLYLVLHYEEGHWDLPKGHTEEGESELETAKREIEEETGLQNLEFYEGFRKTISYFYVRKGEKIPKEVVFFLAKASQKEITLSDEHKGYAWLPFNLAKRKLTYENTRQLLEAAEAFLKAKG